MLRVFIPKRLKINPKASKLPDRIAKEMNTERVLPPCPIFMWKCHKCIICFQPFTCNEGSDSPMALL